MERVRFRTKLSEFSRTLTELVNLDEVAKTTVHFITQTLHVDSVVFFFLKNEVNEYRPNFGAPLHNEMKYSSQHPFVKRIESNGRAVDLEHLRESEGEVEEIDDLIKKGRGSRSNLFEREIAGFYCVGEEAVREGLYHGRTGALRGFLKSNCPCHLQGPHLSGYEFER